MKYETERLFLTEWNENELDVFHLLNSDTQIMRFFPAPKSYTESEQAFHKNKNDLSQSGLGFCALRLKHNAEIIGMAGVLTSNIEPIFDISTRQLAWRVLPQFQKQGFASEAAFALLNYAFNNLKLDKVVAYAVKDNLASIKTMQRIGMQQDKITSFIHPLVPNSHPDLKLHVAYIKYAPDKLIHTNGNKA